MGLASISYDSTDILRDFAERRRITFPLLADPDSGIIRRFGLFNDTIDPSSRDYGIPYPGTFLVDADGVVRQKFSEEHYIHRMPVTTLMVRMGKAAPPAAPQGIRRLDYLEVHTTATEERLYPGNVFTLFVDVHPRPGVHVYAPGLRDYQGMQVVLEENPYVKVRDVQYAPAETLTLPLLGEEIPVYSHPVRVSIDASLPSRQELAPLLDVGGKVQIRGTINLQACDDRVCWPPQTLPVEWTFSLTPPELERSPEPLRHQPKG
ncbi:MAG: redoxin domain-containing protein [Armatimonadetes bacterium]|nr:redoxin domain-containing protein [Armatimonadota bacterium]